MQFNLINNYTDVKNDFISLIKKFKTKLACF